MNRLDGKGYHPKVRLYVPHGKYGRIIRKIKFATPAAWQLAMIRLGMRFVALRRDSLELADLATSEAALFEPSYIEVGCADTKAWYVDTTGCGMLQANQANPPPKESFVSKALHKAKGFIMNLGKVLSLAGLMALANACGKDPEPTPEPEPIVPTKDWVIDWDWENAPDTNLIKQYANDPSTRTIILNLLPSTTARSFCPIMFNIACNNLEEKFFSISPNNMKGSGTIFVNETGGAQLPNPEETNICGMAKVDSLRYTALGFNVKSGKPSR